jgi:proteic killer suppression protein
MELTLTPREAVSRSRSKNLAVYPDVGYSHFLVAIFRVVITGRARKQLRRCPGHIVDKLETWVDAVEQRGLEEVRKIPGYHDEPLHGDRTGQRSIRLSRSYRAIYVVLSEGRVEFVQIEEVSKHAY